MKIRNCRTLVALLMSTLLAAPAWAETHRGEILEIKQSSTSGTRADRNAYLALRLEGFSGTDTICSANGVTTLTLSSDRAMFQSMMNLALASFMSGRRFVVFFTRESCRIHAVSIVN